VAQALLPMSIYAFAFPLCSFVSFVVSGFGFPITRDVGDERDYGDFLLSS
jgi:hypothetical protein